MACWLPHVGLDLHAYAIMSNHVVLRLRPDRVLGWDAETVTRHALAVMPARTGLDRSALVVLPEVVARHASQEGWVAQQRERLSTPSWLMRMMKQEIALHANRREGFSIAMTVLRSILMPSGSSMLLPRPVFHGEVQ